MSVRCTLPNVDHSVGDTTDLLPRVAAARRNLHILLVVLTAGLLTVVVVLSLRPPRAGSSVSAETSAALAEEARRLSLVIKATLDSSRNQATTMSQGTQIRAGIMTDAATVKDLVTSEIQLPRTLNQTLELVQLMDAQRTVLLRMPDGAPAIGVTHAGETRFEIDGRKQLAAVVGVPIVPVDQNAQMLGELILSTPLDFDVTKDNLAAHATKVAISGDKWSLPIADAPGTAGPAQHIPIPIPGAPALALDVEPLAASSTASWVLPIKLGAGVLALVLALVLAISLYRNRAP